MDFLSKNKFRSATGFDFSAFSKHQNFVNFMPVNYDKYHSLNETLREMHISNVKQKIEDLIESGISAEKIVFGVSFGGPLFTNNTDISGNANDAATTFSRIVNHNFICEKLSKNESKWEKFYDVVSALTVLVKHNEEQKQIVVFEGSRSIANRIRLIVVAFNLAGVAAITMDMDNFRGNCELDKNTFNDFEMVIDDISFDIPKRNDTTFLLLKTINNAIVFALNSKLQGNFGNSSHFPLI